MERSREKRRRRISGAILTLVRVAVCETEPSIECSVKRDLADSVLTVQLYLDIAVPIFPTKSVLRWCYSAAPCCREGAGSDDDDVGGWSERRGDPDRCKRSADATNKSE